MPGTFVDTVDWSNPASPAIGDGTRRISYGELREESGRIAASLVQRFGTGGLIVVRARPTCDFVSTLLAIMFSGNTPVPVNPDLHPDDLDYIRGKSGAAAVIDPQAAEPGGDEVFRPDPSMPAMVLFTSGTSGFPKGVVVSHANLGHSCRAVARYLQYRDFPSAAVVLPLFYSYALLSQVCCQLTIGGYVRLFAGLANPIRFAQIVAEENLQTFCGVPSTYHALCVIHALSPLSMPGVRILCSAGAAMDAARFAEIKQIFPSSLFFNNYGMTEAAPRIAYIREDDPRFFEPTCGRPIEGVEVAVVDPDTHARLPEGRMGVLVVKGPNITAGYLNDPEVTNHSFTSDGFLISGDMASLCDGYIYIAGRADDMFNVGGEKVSPLEIERVLNSLPAVDTSAVAGFLDKARGMVPLAYLKVRQPLRRAELLQQLKGRLIASKIPQRFFEVSGFPTTANGKLQRRKLSPEAPSIAREIV
jgi:acyl-CoA synthetase (AMP-forming)/AMP-acid ligase II